MTSSIPGLQKATQEPGGAGAEVRNSHRRKVIRYPYEKGTSAHFFHFNTPFSRHLSSKPIRVWVPGTAHKGLSVMIIKGFPKQASYIQASQMPGQHPGYISRKIATSIDKTLSVLTPPWLRESGWVCAGGQVEVGKEKRQFLKFSWNVRNMKQPMFTQSFPNPRAAFK